MDTKYAVIKIQGSQYRVSEKEEILVNKISGKPEMDILLFVEGEKVIVGKPFVKDAVVQCKVLGEEKGKKIDVIKFKAKSRYRRKTGFRPQYTRLLIEKISLKK